MMKGFSFSVGRGASLTPDARRSVEVYDPAAIQARLNRSMRRRISDDLEHFIRRALLSGHVDTAERLLDVLRSLFAAEKEQYPHGRRPMESIVDTLAREIAAARAGERAA